jgi:hypothetical protein
MKVIDKTPLQDEKGQISTAQRLRGTLEHGLGWYPRMEAQKVVMAQLERVLEKGFTLLRNVPLAPSPIVEPLILIGPPGIYVIEVPAATGFYEAKGDQWNVVKGAHASPAPSNLMTLTSRLARALQTYLERQGVTLPAVVEPVLMAPSPALHIDSLRPMVRVVLSDAIRPWAVSLLQARPVLSPETVYDLTERILTPRPKPAAPAVPAEPSPTETPEYIPPGLRDFMPEEQEPEEAQAPSRARAIFHAAETAKPFDPADLDFAFDESAEAAQGGVPGELVETSPSQQLGRRRLPFSPRQLILLGGMVVVECCVLATFAYLIFTSSR